MGSQVLSAEEMARRKSMSISEEDAFKAMLDEILEDVNGYAQEADMEETIDWLRKVVKYNVPHGKQIRGRGVVTAYRFMVPKPKEDDIRLTYVLGWCIEMFQACFLMADDMIDNSETRRGKPCWYLCPGVGSSAINDSFIVYGLLHHILDKYFREKSYYPDLTQLFHSVYLKTAVGQSIDIRASKLTALEDFKMAEYWRLVEYKTSYYTFFLPVASAMIMAERNDPEDWEMVKSLIRAIGRLFQVQDDYLDVFGDSTQTGKFGSDIAENKCSWLILKAYQEADKVQRQILMENYGKGKRTTRENVAKVKDVFRQLRIKESYAEFEEQAYAAISKQISSLSPRIPRDVFQETADLIHHRTK